MICPLLRKDCLGTVPLSNFTLFACHCEFTSDVGQDLLVLLLLGLLGLWRCGGGPEIVRQVACWEASPSFVICPPSPEASSGILSTCALSQGFHATEMKTGRQARCTWRSG